MNKIIALTTFVANAYGAFIPEGGPPGGPPGGAGGPGGPPPCEAPPNLDDAEAIPCGPLIDSALACSWFDMESIEDLEDWLRTKWGMTDEANMKAIAPKVQNCFN